MYFAMKRITLSLTLLASAVGLSGCLALPIPLQIASIAADIGSYAVTGKSVTDHALSAAADQDCAILRFAAGDAICRADDEEVFGEVVIATDEELASYSGTGYPGGAVFSGYDLPPPAVPLPPLDAPNFIIR